MSARTHANGDMQQALRLLDIIGVERAAAHVQVTAVVRNRRANRTGDPGPRRFFLSQRPYAYTEPALSPLVSR